MPGRRPKPTALKLATGNPGKRPLNQREAKTEGLPDAPGHLSAKAQGTWDKVLPILITRGLAGDLDSMAIERLCETYAEILTLQKVVNEQGHTYECETEGGGTMVRPRPEVAMLADLDRRFKAWLVEFGMTPAARSKVQTSDPKDGKDPDEAWMRPAI